MKTTVRGLTVLLLLHALVSVAEPADQIAKDIESIASIVAADEQRYVTNYLNKGPSIWEEYLTAAMARNALNRISDDPRLKLALARAMYRHAVDTNLPSDTRQYAFARLVNDATRNEEIAAMTRLLAEGFLKGEQSPLKRAAEKYLGLTSQISTKQPSSGLTASSLLGRWRHTDTANKLVTHITFKQDGTYVGRVEEDGKANGSFSGKWTVKDRHLYYEYTASSDTHIPVGTKDQDSIITLATDHYSIENTLGLRETYVRME